METTNQDPKLLFIDGEYFGRLTYMPVPSWVVSLSSEEDQRMAAYTFFSMCEDLYNEKFAMSQECHNSPRFCEIAHNAWKHVQSHMERLPFDQVPPQIFNGEDAAYYQGGDSVLFVRIQNRQEGNGCWGFLNSHIQNG